MVLNFLSIRNKLSTQTLLSSTWEPRYDNFLILKAVKRIQYFSKFESIKNHQINYHLFFFQYGYEIEMYTLKQHGIVFLRFKNSHQASLRKVDNSMSSLWIENEDTTMIGCQKALTRDIFSKKEGISYFDSPCIYPAARFESFRALKC